MRAARLRDALLWTSVVVAAGAMVASLRSDGFPGNGDSWTLGAVAIGYCALGWLVASRQPELPIGWLLLAGGAVQAWSFLATWWVLQGLVGEPGSLPLAGLAAWLSVWLSPLPWPLVLVAPLVLFPNGRARSPRWRRFLVVISAVIGALVAFAAIVALPVAVDSPIELVDLDSVARGTAAQTAINLRASARWIGFSATIVALSGVLYAWRRTSGLERRQYSIVLVGVSVVVANSIVGAVIPAVSGQRVDGPGALGAFTLLAIASAIAIAVVRYRLYNVDVLVSRTVLAVLVAALLAAIYTTVLVVLARVLDDSTALSIPGVVAAGAVVIATSPVASWATRTTRRWFGRAADSTTVAARFSGQPDATDDAEMVVERLAVTVRDELRLGSVQIVVDGLEPAIAGTADGPTWSMVLNYQGRSVGEIIVTARAGERLAEFDQRALEQIGHYVSVAAEAIRVGEHLRHAERALREAHLEERRRIRLDLHDGIGPTLASIRLKLLALRRRLPAELDVDDLVDQTADAIREVRRIVDGLQPSVVEDLGLVPALQILVADTRQTSGIDVSIDSDSDLSDIPAHIAATSYRMVAEGLANVVRHSRSSTCTIHLRQTDHELTIAIRDNGCGFDPTTPQGMGLRSIASRASAVGGDVSITSTDGVGTTLAVRLPA
jgi:signal transduction histidine kinase